MQQKDVIYIDVEDDITAIISKVKGAKEKIVALVPPKRIGVLQSAVNLRLLERAASDANKRLVIITGNSALSGLAASAKIPVAKNLQSKPEIAQIPALSVDDDDVIDGEQLPVGEHAKQSESEEIPVSGLVPPSTIDTINIDGESAQPQPKAPASRASNAKKGIKVPDFGTFRKKMFIAAGAGILLIAFLIWAIWFAPNARVIVSAKTTDQALNTGVTLGTDLTTDGVQNTIKSIQQEEKVSQSIDFDATGSKDVGEKATGQVKMSALSPSPINVAAGTILTTDGGLQFITTTSAVIPQAVVSFPNCFPTACSSSTTVGVAAKEGGTKYNNASGNLSGVSGVTASFTAPSAGGTEKIVKVVVQADVQKAKEQLAEQNNEEMKKKLREKIGNDATVIDSSFKVSNEDPQSSPAIGQEASSGKAKLTQEVTYSMVGIAKSDLDTYLDNAFRETLTNKDKQRVYDNGRTNVKFEEFKAGERNATATITATAQVGPKINDDEIKQQVKGKRTGEIIGDLKAIDGVSDVEVKLSPFWVQGVPDDVKKITIEFKLLKNNG